MLESARTRRGEIEPLVCINETHMPLRTPGPIHHEHGNEVIDVLQSVAPGVRVVPITFHQHSFAAALRYLMGRPDISVVNCSKGFPTFKIQMDSLSPSKQTPEELARCRRILGERRNKYLVMMGHVCRRCVFVKSMGNSAKTLGGGRRKTGGYKTSRSPASLSDSEKVVEILRALYPQWCPTRTCPDPRHGNRTSGLHNSEKNGQETVSPPTPVLGARAREGVAVPEDSKGLHVALTTKQQEETKAGEQDDLANLILAINYGVHGRSLARSATTPGAHAGAQRRGLGAPANGVYCEITDKFESGSSFGAPQIAALAAMIIENLAAAQTPQLESAHHHEQQQQQQASRSHHCAIACAALLTTARRHEGLCEEEGGRGIAQGGPALEMARVLLGRHKANKNANNNANATNGVASRSGGGGGRTRNRAAPLSAFVPVSVQAGSQGGGCGGGDKAAPAAAVVVKARARVGRTTTGSATKTTNVESDDSAAAGGGGDAVVVNSCCKQPRLEMAGHQQAPAALEEIREVVVARHGRAAAGHNRGACVWHG